MPELRMDEGMPVERSVGGLHDALVPRVMELVDAKAAVLDVGCGSGAWLERLARNGFTNLVGIDQDVGQLRSEAGQFVQGDLDSISDWPVPAKSYDLITAIEVIEHLSNIGHFLAQTSKLLAPDGYLLLTTPNILSLAARLRLLVHADMKQFGKLGDQTHLFPVVLGTFPRLLARHQLQLVDHWGYPADGRTLTSRGTANLIARMLRIFLPEPVPGDVLCMLIRHAGAT